MNDRLIRLFVIAFAVICAYVVYEYLMKRIVLDKLCLVNTNDCVWLEYWSYQNTALVDMQPTGYSVFLTARLHTLLAYRSAGSTAAKKSMTLYTAQLTRSILLPEFPLELNVFCQKLIYWSFTPNRMCNPIISMSEPM